jgi:hypothetical protein
MKTLSISTIGLAVAFGSTAFAGPWHPAPRPATAPAQGGNRAVGVHVVPHPDKPRDAKTNPPHEVIIHDPKTNKDEHHPVIIDHRPDHIVNRDPHVRVIVRGYHPQHDWARFHRPHGGWWSVWGITAWDNVGSVTCEAANEANGALYPVSEDRDANGWDDDTVNAILDQALDDCYAEANGAACGPVTPACSFQPY